MADTMPKIDPKLPVPFLGTENYKNAELGSGSTLTKPIGGGSAGWITNTNVGTYFTTDNGMVYSASVTVENRNPNGNNPEGFKPYSKNANLKLLDGNVNIFWNSSPSVESLSISDEHANKVSMTLLNGVVTYSDGDGNNISREHFINKVSASLKGTLQDWTTNLSRVLPESGKALGSNALSKPAHALPLNLATHPVYTIQTDGKCAIVAPLNQLGAMLTTHGVIAPQTAMPASFVPDSYYGGSMSDGLQRDNKIRNSVPQSTLRQLEEMMRDPRFSVWVQHIDHIGACPAGTTAPSAVRPR